MNKTNYLKKMAYALSLGIFLFSCQEEPTVQSTVEEIAPEFSLANLEADIPMHEIHVENGKTTCNLSGEEGKQIRQQLARRGAEVKASGKIKGTRSRANSSANIVVFYDGFPPAAQAAFQSAVDTWAEILVSDVTIEIFARYTPLAPGLLGSAGPTTAIVFDDAPPGFFTETFYPQALANSLVGVDTAPDVDIVAQFSSNINWYFGTDGNTPPNQFDFSSVVLHELCHGLGFLGTFTVSNGQGGLLLPLPFPYDQFTKFRKVYPLIDTEIFDLPFTPTLAQALTSNDVSFSGPNTFFPARGQAKLFAPNPFIQGSSYSHEDEFRYPTGSGVLMTPSFAAGESVAEPDDITLGIMADIGWELNFNPFF